MSLSDVTGDYSILTRNSICLFCPQSNGSLGWCQSHKQCAKVISVKITQHFTAAWHKSQHRSITGKHWYACAVCTSRNDIIHHRKSYCICQLSPWTIISMLACCHTEMRLWFTSKARGHICNETDTNGVERLCVLIHIKLYSRCYFSFFTSRQNANFSKELNPLFLMRTLTCSSSLVIK